MDCVGPTYREDWRTFQEEAHWLIRKIYYESKKPLRPHYIPVVQDSEALIAEIHEQTTEKSVWQ